MNATTQARYKVGGMDCASCATKIDTAVRRMPGVEDVSVSVASGTLTVKHDGTGDLGAIEKKVAGLGYSLRALGQKAPAKVGANGPLTPPPLRSADLSPRGEEDGDGAASLLLPSGEKVAAERSDEGEAGHGQHSHDGGHDHSHNDHATTEIESLHGHDHGPMDGPWWKSAKGRLTILVGIALAVAYGIGHLLPAYDTYIFTAAMLIGLVPIARRAIMAALAGTPFSIEMLMTIAAVGAVVINASEEAAAVVFLFLIGELLEGVAAGKARQSIQSLTALVPKNALLEENGQTREVPAESLAVGATILVRPGDRISAD
ncbi:heavy metal translocating P-type ATPase, partial [Neorhizobium sp. SHOUNA12B]